MAPADGHRSSSGRNAPSTSRAEHQYNASNDTVSKILGGRRPEWLVTGSSSVKPTPRPPKRPPKESLPKLPPTRANNSSQQSHQQYQLPLAPVARTTLPAPAAAAASVRSQLLPPSRSPPKAAQTIAASLTYSAILPSPAPSDGLSPAVSASVDVSSPAQIQPPAPEDIVSAIFEVVVVEEGTDARVPVQKKAPTTDGLATTTITIEGAISPASGSATTIRTPPTPSAPNAMPMTVPLPPTGMQEPAAKRRRVGNMAQNLLTALEAVHNIDHQVRQSGGEDALANEVERPRYQLLRNACIQGDLFFVVLHQVFCSWSHSNGTAHALCVENNHDPNLIDNAFGLMGTILKSNSKLRAEHTQFFMNFPRSLETLRTQSPLYAQTISQVLSFLTLLSQAWMIVNNEHRRVGYPLLMDELLGTFGLYSTNLQTIVFRASRRTIGVPDGPIGHVMDELFRKDQMTHMESNGNFFMITTENHANAPHNQVLIQNYCALVAQARSVSQQVGQSPDNGHQQFQQHNIFRTNPQILPTNQNSAAARYGNGAGTALPALPSNGAGIQSPTNFQFSATTPVGNNFAFTQNAVSHHYQVPPAYFSGLQANMNVNSPTNNHYSNTTSPAQSPIMNQVQPFHVPGRPVSQLSGGARPSPPTQNYPHQFHSRRTSQQFQVPSSRSPQMQNLAGLPQQGRGSPIQHNINQAQSARIPGRASPLLQSITPRVSPQLRHSITPNVPSHVQNAGDTLFTPEGSPLDRTTNQQAYTPAQQQQRFLLDQQIQITNTINQARQSNIRPQLPNQRQFHPGNSNMNGAASVDWRRTQPAQILPSHYPHDPNDRKSLEMSLHQAPLRSPRRLLRGVGFSSPPERYYQFVKYLAFQPVPIPQRKFLHIFRFDMPEVELDKISSDATQSDLSLPANIYFDGSLRVRLRVILVKTATRSISEGDWVAMDSHWPEHIQIQLNQQPLMLKRKHHHAKDQPAEIGMYINPGENVLKVAVPVQRPFENNAVPFISIEVIETLSHSSVYALPNLSSEATITSEQTRAVIQKRLGGSSVSDDDEIAMVSNDLAINIADPFSFTLWNIPVRGKDCTHLECFDLETWLSTRPGKKSCSCGVKKSSDCKNCPKEPSVVDKWKCPLCQGDARPHSLRIDGFLSEVRQALAEQGLLRVKEIKVTADGSWRAVIPDDDDDDDDDDFGSDEYARPKVTTHHRLSAAISTGDPPPQRSRASIEIICLDDD